MKRCIYKTAFFLIFLYATFTLTAQNITPTEIAKWQKQAKNINIIRDNWGIPHIYGVSDADAVFGLMYAQCEDDFTRIEMNYIEKLGRMAEVKGEEFLQNDLYIKLIIDSVDAIADYHRSPIWLKKLLNAYADGINFYLYNNPKIKPILIQKFMPWYPLMWTDGSIGAISTGNITEREVANFYLSPIPIVADIQKLDDADKTTGSNGFAVSPLKTKNGNAILYINPHVSFYFRPEVHVISNQGLNVYGAVTWGQFFIYQGFNEHCGWMHTSSNVDVSDMYAEKVIKKNNQLFYQYNDILYPIITKQISLSFKQNNSIIKKNITTYFTAHGPIMAKRKGQWISVKSYNRSLSSLIQSWQRTKTKNFEAYKNNMALLSNTSNNTVYADDKGNIAYWHGNFIPVRDKNINWSNVVDGTTSATDWKKLHQLNEIIHVYNPQTGWIQNCNSTPFTVSGISSPKKENYPSYMAPDGENFRALNAAKLLGQQNNFTLDKIIQVGYDNKLSAFEILIPALINSFEKNVKQTDTLYQKLNEAIEILKKWDYRCDTNSIATTIAVEWGYKINDVIRKIYIDNGDDDQVTATNKFINNANTNQLLLPLLSCLVELKNKFNTWQIPWGNINRFQRISANINQQYSDSAASVAMPFASSTWGMLPAYNSKYFGTSKKRYGVSGNSFVCAVEFGKKVKAKSLLAGGETSNLSSPHFNDQIEMYSKGIFKEVLFYKKDILLHAEKKYHPGQ